MKLFRDIFLRRVTIDNRESSKVWINEIRALNWKLKFLTMCFDECLFDSSLFFICLCVFYLQNLLLRAGKKIKTFCSITSQYSSAWIFHFNNGAIASRRCFHAASRTWKMETHVNASLINGEKYVFDLSLEITDWKVQRRRLYANIDKLMAIHRRKLWTEKNWFWKRNISTVELKISFMVERRILTKFLFN